MLLIWFMNGDGQEVFVFRALVGSADAICVSMFVYRLKFLIYLYVSSVILLCRAPHSEWFSRPTEHV